MTSTGFDPAAFLIMADMGVFNASLLRDDTSWKLQKINLLMPEDIAIVSGKSGFDRCTHDRVISMTRKNADGWTAFQLYSRLPIFYILSTKCRF